MPRTAEQNQARTWAKFADGAARLGSVFDHYRPAGPDAPLDPANRIGTVRAGISSDNLAFASPSQYGKPARQCMWDGRLTAVGDYFVGIPGTFFVAAQQLLLPPVAIECNEVASFARPGSSDAVGEITTYGGGDLASQVALATGWPCSRLTKSRGEKSDANLPGDVKAPWLEFLVPAMPGVRILYDDIIDCTDGQRFLVSSAELSPLGWRILAMLAAA